jgi:hypothetical protein
VPIQLVDYVFGAEDSKAEFITCTGGANDLGYPTGRKDNGAQRRHRSSERFHNLNERLVQFVRRKPSAVVGNLNSAANPRPICLASAKVA